MSVCPHGTYPTIVCHWCEEKAARDLFERHVVETFERVAAVTERLTVAVERIAGAIGHRDELERLREENENLVKLADYLGRAALRARGEALDG